MNQNQQQFLFPEIYSKYDYSTFEKILAKENYLAEFISSNVTKFSNQYNKIMHKHAQLHALESDPNFKMAQEVCVRMNSFKLNPSEANKSLTIEKETKNTIAMLIDNVDTANSAAVLELRSINLNKDQGVFDFNNLIEILKINLQDFEDKEAEVLAAIINEQKVTESINDNKINQLDINLNIEYKQNLENQYKHLKGIKEEYTKGIEGFVRRFKQMINRQQLESIDCSLNLNMVTLPYEHFVYNLCDNLLYILNKNKYQLNLLINNFAQSHDIILVPVELNKEYQQINQCSLIKSNNIFESLSQISSDSIPQLTIQDASVMLTFLNGNNTKISYTLCNNIEYKFENGNLYVKTLNNQQDVFPAPIIPKDSVEVGLCIGYILVSNKDILQSDQLKKQNEVHSSKGEDIMLSKEKLLINPDTKNSKQQNKELNKTINMIFEEKPQTNANDMFSSIHIISKRPNDISIISDVKFIQAPWKKILKFKQDQAVKLIPGNLKKNKFSKWYADQVDIKIKSDKGIDEKSKNQLSFWTKNPALMSECFLPNQKLTGAEQKQQSNLEKQKAKDRKRNNNNENDKDKDKDK